MRLVDADAIKDKLERKIINPQTAFINSILINLLYEAPTAYDVDKVVEQLEELIQGCQEVYDDSMALGNLQMRTASRNQAIALKQAIGIVENGG